MKPCSRNQKRIAWLALGALEAREAAALREHLAVCDGCRRHWEEISNVTEKLSAARPDSELHASALFHQRVAEKLQAADSGNVLEKLAEYFREVMTNWRVVLPVATALVIAVVALAVLRQPGAVAPPGPALVKGASASGTDSDAPSTAGNYEMAGSQSLEKLDELVTKQGNRRLPPAPVYTASSFRVADEAF